MKIIIIINYNVFSTGSLRSNVQALVLNFSILSCNQVTGECFYDFQIYHNSAEYHFYWRLANYASNLSRFVNGSSYINCI